jgi:predicted nucleic acid-binding protein
VVDASVGVKWYVPEVHSERALSLLEAQQNTNLAIHVPDLFLAGTGNILWKKVRRKEISEREAAGISRALLAVPKTSYPTEILMPTALDIACRSGRTVYDSLYLALAALIDSPLITADQRLFRSLKETRWKQLVSWIGDV